MSHTDADRKDFHEGRKITAHRERVARWLADTPEIGVLNSGKYYVIDRSSMPEGVYREIAEFGDSGLSIEQLASFSACKA